MRQLGPREVPGLAPHQPAKSRQSWDLNPRIWPQSLMAFASMPSVIFYWDVLLSLEFQQHLMLISAKTLFIFFNMYVFMCLHWSSRWHAGSSVVACEISCGMWDPVPWPEIEPRPPHWEHGVPGTGKSWIYSLEGTLIIWSLLLNSGLIFSWHEPEWPYWLSNTEIIP